MNIIRLHPGSRGVTLGETLQSIILIKKYLGLFAKVLCKCCDHIIRKACVIDYSSNPNDPFLTSKLLRQKKTSEKLLILFLQ